MTLTLGFNRFSGMVQRSLNSATKELASVFERLSSGQRINRASDDAAGLAIAESLRTDARLYTGSIRNINDGISLLNVMESALDSQEGIVLRLRELAVQSSSGSLSDTQRDALDLEYQSLVEEFGRIGDSAEFNGIKLLDDEQSIALQIGIDSSSNSQISVSTDDFGDGSGVISSTGDYNGDGLVNIGDLGEIGANFVGTLSPEDFFNLFGQNYQRRTVTDSSGEEREVYQILLLGAYNTGGDPDDTTGGLYYFYEDSSGMIRSAGNTGVDPSLTGSQALSFSDFGTTSSIDYDISSYEIRPLETYGAGQESALDYTGVDTASRALAAIDVLDVRASELRSFRSEIGASVSRLTFALSTAEQSRESYSIAESRIRDVDIAEEAAKLTRTQILQQAGAAVLSQANLQPSLALQLLRGLNQ